MAPESQIWRHRLCHLRFGSGGAVGVGARGARDTLSDEQSVIGDGCSALRVEEFLHQQM
jgi:hypothetical protein